MKDYVKITLIITVSYLLTFLTLFAVQCGSSYHATDLKEHILLDIQRSDGSYEEISGIKFPTISTGDRMTAHISIPEDIAYDNPVLCFGLYNCVLEVSFQDQILYRYGQELYNAGHHIGSVFACVPFPQEAVGSQLTLKATAAEKNAAGEFVRVSCLPGMEARHWLVLDRLPDTVFLVMTLTVSFMMTITLILSDGRRKFIRLSLWLLSFMSIVTTYRMASNGTLYSLIGVERICSHVEYILFFAMPLPLLIFCAEFFEGRRSKICCTAAVLLQTLFFLLATVLNYTTARYHYCSLLKLQHLILFCMMLTVILVGRKASFYEENASSSKCMRNSLYSFFVCVVLDTLRYYIRKFTPFSSPILDFDYLFLGILIMSACFTLSIFLKVTQVFTEKNQKNYYEHLAYTDILTGLGNRTKYYEHITSMRIAHTVNFTIFFMDLNNLKQINDHFGHEYGDLYIKAAAKAISLVFTEADASYRIGGDEFLVICTKPLRESCQVLCHQVKTVFRQVCSSQGFPFQGAIACGVSVSTADVPLDIESAVRQADSKMYRDKACQKAQSPEV